jgi:hypothetical protein
VEPKPAEVVGHRARGIRVGIAALELRDAAAQVPMSKAGGASANVLFSVDVTNGGQRIRIDWLPRRPADLPQVRYTGSVMRLALRM